ncbi:LCP family protein [Halobacillus rhizosphaerae]|uniref:LCP family glycopolymer transferase n=1 Tax=Halobacillus rhizosphaerae TaxID=3064889 RepID=UPI00398AF299
MSNRKERKTRKKGNWWKILLALLLVIGVSIGVYVFSIYHDAKQTVSNDIHKSVKSIDSVATKKKIKNEETLHVLLMGVDARPGDKGRSDALMVMSLDPNHDKMQIVSIPRDTRTTIVGRGSESKINAAYAYGGPDMAINTVENFLDIDLDYYVKVNMEGLSQMVDAVGGVTVDNDRDWYDEGYYKKGYHYKKGEIHLDGPKTMGYVRMRHLDNRGDFGRNKRQRQVIEAVMNKGSSVGSLNKITSIIDVLGNNVETNMDFKDMKNLYSNYRSTRNNVDTYEMSGNGQMIGKGWYLLVPDSEIQKVHNMITAMNS